MKLPKIPYWPLLLGPMLMFGLGFAMNAIVCGVNGASMPVLVPSSMTVNGCPIDPEDWIHHCMTAQTHLKILADWIAINHLGIASPGDLLEWASEATSVPAFFLWIGCILKDANK